MWTAFSMVEESSLPGVNAAGGGPPAGLLVGFLVGLGEARGGDARRRRRCGWRRR